jgi:hypothetical protein
MSALPATSAPTTLTGCDMASITVRDAGGYRTASTTDSDAASVDEMQYAAHEGPCLDAVDAPVVYAQSSPTGGGRRSPTGPPTSASGRCCALVPADRRRPLFAGDPAGGSLNSYGTVTDAFDDQAQEG